MAVRAWGKIISLVMHDKEETVLSIEELVKTSNYITNVDTSVYNKICEKESYLKQDIRDQNWFEAAAIKLGGCVQLLEKVRSNSHYKVRLELIESISLVLQNCFR